MAEHLWPISVKGVLVWDGAVVVLRNQRDEWELPGGRLEPGDRNPAVALEREFREELDLDVTVGELLDCWIYDVAGKRVVIVAYACSAERPDELRHSHEHSAVALLTADQLELAAIPAGNLTAIRRGLGKMP